MQRRNFYYRQLVTEADLDEVFDLAEDADHALMVDMGQVGILDGLDISEAAVPNLTVECDAGVAYDQDGQRMYVSSLQSVNVAVDKDAVSTDVANPGNKKWVSVFLKFKRTLSNPKTDGNNVTVQYNRAESFEFIVEQSAEDVVPSRPNLKSDAILLADIERSEGVSTITNANVDVSRRQWAYNVSAGSYSIKKGQSEEAVGEMLSIFNTFVTALAAGTGAALVGYNGGGTWADGTTNPAATVEAQLDKVITDLANTNNATSGVNRVGAEQITGTSSNITAGTLRSQLVALKSAGYIDLAARTAWLGGRTNPAATLYAGIDKIITDLADTSASDDGAERIGAASAAGTIRSLSSGSVRSQLTDLLSYVNSLEARASVVWGRFSTNGAGSITTIDHEGVDTGSTFVSATEVNIFFSSPFSDTNYAPIVSSVDGSTHRAYKAAIISATQLRVFVIDPVTNTTINPSTNLCAFVIDVKGRR